MYHINTRNNSAPKEYVTTPVCMYAGEAGGRNSEETRAGVGIALAHIIDGDIGKLTKISERQRERQMEGGRPQGDKYFLCDDTGCEYASRIPVYTSPVY